jgi:hypothetical protein
VPVNSYSITESAARKGEIYVGYRYVGHGDGSIVINPPKEDFIVFGEQDQIVVIAEK